MTMLQQVWKKILKKPKTPEQIQKEFSEAQQAASMGLTSELQEIRDPLYTARINFETFKSIFKRNPAISSSRNGRINSDDFQITRMRESDSNGNVCKSMDSIRLAKSSESIRYMEMANRAFGMKAHCDDCFVYFNYDIATIENMRKKKND